MATIPEKVELTRRQAVGGAGLASLAYLGEKALDYFKERDRERSCEVVLQIMTNQLKEHQER